MKIRIIIGLFMSAFLSTNCAENVYNSRLIPTNKKAAATNPFGSYIELEATSKALKGELIAITTDSLFVLSNTYMHAFSHDNVLRFKLVLAQNQSKKYAIAGGLMLIPSLLGAVIHSDYSGEFLTLSASSAILSLIAIAAETEREPSELIFPEDGSDILEFAKYGRFPTGIPEGLDVYELK